jgi:hypothetical protein
MKIYPVAVAIEVTGPVSFFRDDILKDVSAPLKVSQESVPDGLQITCYVRCHMLEKRRRIVRELKECLPEGYTVWTEDDNVPPEVFAAFRDKWRFNSHTKFRDGGYSMFYVCFPDARGPNRLLRYVRNKLRTDDEKDGKKPIFTAVEFARSTEQQEETSDESDKERL